MTITRIDIDATDTTAARFDALSHPVRLRLLRLIAESGGMLTVDELVIRLDMLTQPVVSYHLTKMEDAGVLRHSKHARNVYYAIRPQGLSDMQHELDRLLWQYTQAAAKARRI